MLERQQQSKLDKGLVFIVSSTGDTNQAAHSLKELGINERTVVQMARLMQKN